MSGTAVNNDEDFATPADALKALRAAYEDTIVAARRTTPTYPPGNRFRHWWGSTIGTLRATLREWLGVSELEHTVFGELREAERRLLCLEGDLAQTDDAHTETRLRLEQEEQNLHETVRQLRVVQTSIEWTEPLLRAYRSIPMLKKAEADLLARHRLAIKKARRGAPPADKAPTMAQATAALIGGLDTPGEGWKPVYCAECRVVCGWWDSTQTAVPSPRVAWCTAHRPDGMRPQKPEGD